MRLALLATAILTATTAAAQPSGDSPLTAPQNGPRHEPSTRHMLTGATLYLAPGVVIERGSIVINEGRIVSVLDDEGRPISLARAEDGSYSTFAPTISFTGERAARLYRGEGAREWDYSGHHIYAGFIDPWVEVKVDAPSGKGRHWSAHVMPDRSALRGEGIGDDTAGALRKLGFTAAGIVPGLHDAKGIFRGVGAVVSLEDRSGDYANSTADETLVYANQAFHGLDFVMAGWGGDGSYPTSQIGAMALVRQTLSDARWQADARLAGKTIAHNTLDTLTDLADLPLMFNADDELEVLRAASLAAADGRDLIAVGTGTEYRRLDAIADSGVSMVVPLRYPRRPDVSSVGKAESVDLATLMAWEQAPTNAARLAEAGVNTSLTSAKLRKRADFSNHLDRAIEHGLSADDALAMLTVNPATTLGVDDRIGTIAPGMAASLVITEDHMFDPDEDDREIRDLWIDGRRHQLSEGDDTAIAAGTWEATLAGRFSLTLQIDDTTKVTVSDSNAPELGEVKAHDVSLDGASLSLVFDHGELGWGERFTLTGVIEGSAMSGSGVRSDGEHFTWTAVRTEPFTPEEEDDEDDSPKKWAYQDPDTVPADLPGYPFGPYAMANLPDAEHVVFRGADIWTSADAGIIRAGEIEIRDGEIVYVGENRDTPIAGARIVDATGKHITPGLVDAHSHTGTWSGGTNEAGQAVTSEVRMADTSDPDPVNWYRQLAGGTTTVNTLHGSANPIGGQNVIQKVRWGARHPKDMHLDGATPGIKFALGENVVQVNWGDRFTTRYPKTRMGVEAVMRDRFTAAIEYDRTWQAWRDNGQAGVPPRRDWELEALAEIVRGERLIHCHSYRQDEILMLARVAQDFGFIIGSYQHGLETYKVAEAVKAHSRGGSLFSDWWAYKIEVQDAIPHAGPILWETGTTVSYNSDSDELSRRMAAEAAKAVKYSTPAGGRTIPPAEALKFVTINPAYQLGVDDQVGSLERGKHADLAIWSGDPLSTTSRCESTWIDGREYFSLELDAEHRKTIAAERSRIIQKLHALGAPPAPEDDDGAEDAEAEPESFAQRIRRNALRDRATQLLLEGRSIEDMTCGDCGCSLAHFGVIR